MVAGQYFSEKDRKISNREKERDKAKPKPTNKPKKNPHSKIRLSTELQVI